MHYSRKILAILVASLAVSLFVPAYAQDGAAPLYTCPMHPQVIAEEPGNCPICGMALVEQGAGHDHSAMSGPDSAGEKPVITIEAGVTQKMGVRTEPVEKAPSGALSVPSSAILRSSSGSHVIVALGEGRFQGRDVETGAQQAGRTEIRSGLSADERVVTRAQFLIDSESNLREALEAFRGGGHAGH